MREHGKWPHAMQARTSRHEGVKFYHDKLTVTAKGDDRGNGYREQRKAPEKKGARRLLQARRLRQRN
jgi:hypothetical protein